MSADLVKAYTAYRVKRSAIKARQRKQLEEELKTDKIAIGTAINALRDSGSTVSDIYNIIGLRNRNFIFECTGLVKSASVTEKQDAAKTVNTDSMYMLTYNGNSVNVAVSWDGFTNDYVVYLHNGEVVGTPDEWVSAPKEKRELYKRIIQEIEANNVHTSE